jgi:hypothetical protein
MTVSADQATVFIEPVSQDLETYTVYRKADKKTAFTKFECTVVDQLASTENIMLRPNADDSTLRTFRLALSVTNILPILVELKHWLWQQ